MSLVLPRLALEKHWLSLSKKLYRARWGAENEVGCIILSPTRELTSQLFKVDCPEDIAAYIHRVGCSILVWRKITFVPDVFIEASHNKSTGSKDPNSDVEGK
ncbi:unnamed protein product [Victoria cruziana]